jgi:hypothetical protein
MLGDSRMQVDKLITEARAEADQSRRAAQREVDELMRQRDSITGHLDQLRALLGAGAGAAPQLPSAPHYAEVLPAQPGGAGTETAADVVAKNG